MTGCRGTNRRLLGHQVRDSGGLQQGNVRLGHWEELDRYSEAEATSEEGLGVEEGQEGAVSTFRFLAGSNWTRCTNQHLAGVQAVKRVAERQRSSVLGVRQTLKAPGNKRLLA